MNRRRALPSATKPVQILDGLPLVRQEDEYETREWVDLIERIWDRVSIDLSVEVMGIAGVSGNNGQVIVLDSEEGLSRDEYLLHRQLWKKSLRPLLDNTGPDYIPWPAIWAELPLFIPLEPGESRQYHNSRLLVTKDGWKIRFWGEQWDMGDSVLLMYFFCMVGDGPISDQLETSFEELNRVLGQGTPWDGVNLASIQKKLDRLASGLMVFSTPTGEIVFRGHLLDDWSVNDGTGTISVRFHRGISFFFGVFPPWGLEDAQLGLAGNSNEFTRNVLQ